ncbi:galactokinase [Microbacterium sp. IEGM 1404]|uniref:galactokinase n=1 Tax=Microbacterium sp. IEGM 1404 TaxID=3047084 RepID=UPI0024B7D52E|nr:galactokinase [Microbacterium sp. IEGM 1404]MDI9891232.1 galactokinase [Microbacterium sp. IEGM 1404]
MTAVDDARALLATLTDAPAAGVWSAPGRANLIGEHTDYNEGFVLPFAIAQRTAAAVALRDDDVIRVRSTFSADAVEVSLADLDARIAAGGLDWAGYPLGVAWALRAAAPDAAARGVDIALASEVPVGAGLSSSAAIEGAVASALNDVWGAGLDKVALARVGRTAENDAVGAPTGIMDQMASMLGEADAATFLDCRTLETRPVALGFAEAGLAILVVDTLVEHAHSSGGYRERRASCEKGAAAFGVPALRDLTVDDLPRAAEILDDVTFRRVRHIVTENQRVLDTVTALDADGPRAIGDLLTASHASMRDDFEISVPELDLAVETALAAGALGARMTGGGFGGAAIALIPTELVPAATEAVHAAFAASGFRAPNVFTVTPSEGARRDA